MNGEWVNQDTTTHQDHVIAHVIGATVAGYFVFDESLYLLLDIGFIWRIYLDGEMGLLPAAVAVKELDFSEERKHHLNNEVELLLSNRIELGRFYEITPVAVECLIEEVEVFAAESERRLVIRGEQNDLVVETSLQTREFAVTNPSRN